MGKATARGEGQSGGRGGVSRHERRKFNSRDASLNCANRTGAELMLAKKCKEMCVSGGLARESQVGSISWIAELSTSPSHKGDRYVFTVHTYSTVCTYIHHT
jgi:hypothetical protein